MNTAQINKGPQLGRIVMPLVRLLVGDGLSWSEREAIADAIRNTMRIHADMEKEAAHLSGGIAEVAQVAQQSPNQDPFKPFASRGALGG